MAGSPVSAVVALSDGLSVLVTVAPSSPLPVLASVTCPTTRPPGVGSQDWSCTATSSTSHQNPNVAMKWYRNCTVLLPAACGTCTVSRSGPRTLSLPCDQMFVQVCPPSVLTSTLPVWLGNPK